MDYKELIETLKKPTLTEGGYLVDYSRKDAATAITDLLARAEAAEARCSALEKMVKEYQENLIPGYRVRAEKAERERDAYKGMIYKERSCAFCVEYTGEWNAECLSCDRCTKEYRPKFRLRELKEE